MNTQQPEALRLAEMLTANEWPGHVTLVSYAQECVAELRTQHARITELESQLAQRFAAADMATAAAQGFRDGATATAQPVAEPVHTKDALIATMLDALTHARKALNHNNLALECGPVNSAILAARASRGQAPAGESLRTDALCDLSYSHGLKAGWNYCASDDLAGFERAQKIGTEALRTLKSPTAQAAESVPDGPRRKDMLWSTVKMQERHDQRIENIVSGLERIKQEHAGQQPQKIDECYGDCPTDSTTCTNPCRFDGRAARAPADSVQEDAARYRAFRDCSMDDRKRLEHYSGPALDVAVDTFNAARKQGEKQ